DYPPTAKMMSMSTDEVRQIKEYCDSLKKKAEFGDKVMKSVPIGTTKAPDPKSGVFFFAKNTEKQKKGAHYPGSRKFFAI
ncbi:MAG: hypothetical protein IJ982_09085, partial [Fibrobacter sp.]|nr:hypothetical protein [Fibrobacter sp.]